MNKTKGIEQFEANQTHHGCPSDSVHDRKLPEIDLLSPLEIRGEVFRNRIAMSPMCQYRATEGLADDWHLVHLGSRAVGGVALVMVEATAVTRDGRISPGDLGIWEDGHIEPLARIARFVRSQGGHRRDSTCSRRRKGSCDVPWNGGASLKTPQEGGWTVVGPSPIPFAEGDPIPFPLKDDGIDAVIAAFEAAGRRAVAAGFQLIEIHAAHGYLLHEFLSPLSNHRQDKYGGSLENRMRLLLRVATALRRLMPGDMPLFVRISATDWADGGWDVNQSVALACRLKELGVDLIDVSSGALVPKARAFPSARATRCPCAEDPRRGQDHDRRGRHDYRTRACQRDHHWWRRGPCFNRTRARAQPYWALKAEHELGAESSWPTSYGYAVRRRAK